MATFYPDDQHNSILRNEADSANLAGENQDVSDHSTETNFILCCQANYSSNGSCNKDTAGINAKLQFNKDGGGTWYDVVSDSEIAYANVSGLTNDATGGTARCSTTPPGCSGTVNVKDCEDGALDLPAVDAEDWHELKFGLSPANALAGVKYAFRLYDVTNSEPIIGTNANFLAELTIESGAAVALPMAMNTYRQMRV